MISIIIIINIVADNSIKVVEAITYVILNVNNELGAIAVIRVNGIVGIIDVLSGGVNLRLRPRLSRVFVTPLPAAGRYVSCG
jgi:hypothetical protein